MWKAHASTVSLFCCFLVSVQVTAAELSFRGPFGISGTSRPVTVHAGDLDGDDRLDLIASNGSGVVTVFFQDPENPKIWKLTPVRVGASCFFTRAGDFDNDGFDDLVVADGGSSVYYIRSRGDRTFESPRPLRQARGSRWIALGDWNNDGNLDLASSNLSTSTLTTFVGDGEGGFTVTGEATSGREHTLEALDYDGDGIMDLALGTGIPGIQLHHGRGNGTFERKNQVPGHGGLLGCVEYIAVGDFNNDGLDDLAPTCIDDQTAYAGVSLGTGAYRRILKDPFAAGTESSAIGDLDGDGNDDLALVSHGSTMLRVYLGEGDGTFKPRREFASTGTKPVFLISEDLDGDGHDDVVSADETSSRLTVFFGTGDDDILESSQTVTGYGTASAYAVGDFDQDGLPDFFYADALQGRIKLFLKPGADERGRRFNLRVAEKYSILDVADLNGDGTLDLVGGSNSADSVLTAILTPEGTVGNEQSLPCSGNPKLVRIGFLDDGPTVDIATFCSRADELAVFLGNGEGAFEAAPVVPTVEDVDALDVSDIDGDGHDDLVASSPNEIAIHYGLEGGGFASAAFVEQAEELRFGFLEVADLNGDGKPDVLVAELEARSVLFFENKGDRTFGESVLIETSGARAMSTLNVVDADLDGRPDVVVGFRATQTIDIIFNRDPEGFSAPQSEPLGVSLTFVRIVDVDGDRVNDVVAFSRLATDIRRGVSDQPPPSPRFLRGDADNDGKVALNDAVTILNHLFRGAGPLACPDAGDSNDDGTVALTDAVEVLSYLFRGGRSPAAPGPKKCGEDTSEDELGECSEKC